MRLLHHGDVPVIVRAWPTAGAVRVRAEAADRPAAAWGIDRMRFALGLDHDVRPFLRAFRANPLLARALRQRPWLRPTRRPLPFEALAWAITEQLIESTRAAEIQRAMVRRLGRAAPYLPERPPLRDVPACERLARVAPAELDACGLAPKRSIAMRRVAKEVAAGRVDLDDENHERAWARLMAIREIGTWTVDCLAHHGQGRDDRIPAGDLAYLKLIGRIEGLGRLATEDEVREWFRPYAPFEALAGLHLIYARFTVPVRAGTRSSRPRPAVEAA